MTMAGRPNDEQIQNYIDGRLGVRDLAVVAAYLRAHPDVASEIEALRRHNEALKRIGEEILDEPIPDRLRDILRRPSPHKLNGATPLGKKYCFAALSAIAIWLM